MDNKEYFPLFISTSEKRVIVIGGGIIATRRLKTLLKFNFDLVVVSKEITKEIEEICTFQNVNYIKDTYKSEYIKDCFMVIACTNDNECNKKIVDFCSSKNIFSNSCSNKDDCDFFFPSICTNEDVTVGVVGNGNSHIKTKQMADKIRSVL